MTVSVVRYDMKVRQCFEGLKEDRILSVMTRGCHGLIRKNSGMHSEQREILCISGEKELISVEVKFLSLVLNGLFIVTK